MSTQVNTSNTKTRKTLKKSNKKKRNNSISVKGSHEDDSADKQLKKGLVLCNFEHLPAWQRDNECIKTGYLQATHSMKKCFHSLKVFNNETVNVYSHLLPSIAYFVLLLIFTDFLLEQRVLKYIKENPNVMVMNSIDYIMINFYLVGAFLCLFCSSAFHCFKQHSERYSDACSKADYMGIIILITCSIISILYYGFHDHLFIFKVFTILISIMGSICTVFVLHDKFNAPNFKALRALFFVLFAGSALVPIIFGMFKFGIEESFRRVQFFYVFLEALFYMSGAIIYGFRMPERFFPGKFDLIGHSHQIFHVLVVLGSLCHLRAVIGSFVLAHTGVHTKNLFILVQRDQN